MYHVKPYTADFIVEPAKILYHLPDYHESESPSTTSLNDHSVINNAATNDSRKICNKINDPNQQDLIQRLLALSSKLDQFIINTKKEALRSQTEESKLETPTAKYEAGEDKLIPSANSQQPVTSKEDKKSAKKSARKENREAAKNQLKSAQLETPKAVDLVESKLTNQPQFSLKAIAKNCPSIEHANVLPTAPFFPIHDYRNNEMHKTYSTAKIKCTLQSQERPLMEMFNKIGRKRGVLLVGDDQKSSIAAANFIRIPVTYAKDSEISLTINDKIELQSELTIWKFLGSLLGLYSTEDSFVSALTDKWLLMAVANSDNMDNFTRQLSAHLSSVDFLSSPHAILLSDIVLRAKYVDEQNIDLIPWQNLNVVNNVQLWVKRVDDAVNSY